MKSSRPERLGSHELLARVKELERQLESQRELEGLIEMLLSRQEEEQEVLIEAQTELEVSRDRFAELYDFAPVPILTVGQRGIIDSLNLAATRLLAVERSAAVGTPLVVFASPGCRHELLNHLIRCRKESGTVRSELRIRSHSGAEFPVEIRSRCSEVEGRSPQIQSVLLDLTPRYHAEEERARAREQRAHIQQEEAAMRAKDQAKDRFLAVLSHELRTPLTPILLTIEVLESTAADPALKRSLAMIRRNTELQARLIDDLLDVSRIGHNKLHLERSPVLLTETLRHVAELYQPDLERAGIALDLEPGDQPQYVSADPTRLRQIFWNLLKNAIQHTPKGGKVRISIEGAGTSAVRVVVSDNGSGIHPDDVGRLFEAFEQASNDGGQVRTGLGLGLAICRGLVEAHGGSIHVVSPGREGGATFTVELPTCAAPEEQPAPPSENARTQRRISVLLIEDHQDSAGAMLVALGKLGFEVRLASSLAEGRRLARVPFDVLVSDVQLPDGSGLDLMRELCAAGPVKGIAISGYGSEKDVSQSREAGFDRHLVKPVPVRRVVDAIQSLVAS